MRERLGDRTWIWGVLLIVVLGAYAGVHFAVSPSGNSMLSQPARLTPHQIGKAIGAEYGDGSAQVVFARSDKSEGLPSHPMYVMKMSGSFHKGAVPATTLYFSALSDHMYVWDIRAYAGGKNPVWQDTVWPVSIDQALLTPIP